MVLFNTERFIVTDSKNFPDYVPTYHSFTLLEERKVPGGKGGRFPVGSDKIT